MASKRPYPMPSPSDRPTKQRFTSIDTTNKPNSPPSPSDHTALAPVTSPTKAETKDIIKNLLTQLCNVNVREVKAHIEETDSAKARIEIERIFQISKKNADFPVIVEQHKGFRDKAGDRHENAKREHKACLEDQNAVIESLSDLLQPKTSQLDSDELRRQNTKYAADIQQVLARMQSQEVRMNNQEKRHMEELAKLRKTCADDLRDVQTHFEVQLKDQIRLHKSDISKSLSAVSARLEEHDVQYQSVATKCDQSEINQSTMKELLFTAVEKFETSTSSTGSELSKVQQQNQTLTTRLSSLEAQCDGDRISMEAHQEVFVDKLKAYYDLVVKADAHLAQHDEDLVLLQKNVDGLRSSPLSGQMEQITSRLMKLESEPASASSISQLTAQVVELEQSITKLVPASSLDSLSGKITNLEQNGEGITRTEDLKRLDDRLTTCLDTIPSMQMNIDRLVKLNEAQEKDIQRHDVELRRPMSMAPPSNDPAFVESLRRLQSLSVKLNQMQESGAQVVADVRRHASDIAALQSLWIKRQEMFEKEALAVRAQIVRLDQRQAATGQTFNENSRILDDKIRQLFMRLDAIRLDMNSFASRLGAIEDGCQGINDWIQGTEENPNGAKPTLIELVKLVTTYTTDVLALDNAVRALQGAKEDPTSNLAEPLLGLPRRVETIYEEVLQLANQQDQFTQNIKVLEEDVRSKDKDTEECFIRTDEKLSDHNVRIVALENVRVHTDTASQPKQHVQSTAFPEKSTPKPPPTGPAANSSLASRISTTPIFHTANLRTASNQSTNRMHRPGEKIKHKHKSGQSFIKREPPPSPASSGSSHDLIDLTLSDG